MKHKLNSFFLGIILLISLVLVKDDTLFLLLFFSSLALFHVFLFLGIFKIQFNYFIKSIHQIESPNVFLTFDDGPHPNRTPLILDVLKKHNCTATFFIIGKNAQLYPEIVKRIHEEGHTIGNHSYHHNNNIAFISTKKLIEEVRLCSITLEKIIGEKIKLFRPPVGITNPNFARMLSVLGLTSIGWNVRTYDTKIVEAQKLLAFLKSNTKNGNIILLHDTMEVTASILDSYLSDAISKGFTFERINFG